MMNLMINACEAYEAYKETLDLSTEDLFRVISKVYPTVGKYYIEINLTLI